jgi:hypothetical protein
VPCSLQLDGKLGRRRGQLNALGGLIYLQDSVSNQQFLVDTGAAVSVFPHRSAAATSGPLLTGADGKPISSWGKVTKKLNFGLHTFVVSFILAAVSKPILGIDFLAAHRLLVDPFACAVLFASSLEPVGRTISAVPSRFAASISHIAPAVRTLLAAFPAIVGDGKGTPKPRHGVRHFVETSGHPVFAKARRLDPDKLKIAESEFRSLEAAGIVRRSNSPWSSPLHMVPKPDGSWRPCGDYRRLNTVTKPDRYPLPSMLDLSAKLHGCKFFSCVDLVKGYHQIPMAAEDVEKTAIVTPFGLFEYLFMPFGLTNAAQSFQRLMDKLFRHLPFVFTYLDDHLIASQTLEEHLLHLQQFFQVLQDNGLTINPAKCVFAVSSLKFLGHMVDEAGITPLPRHVAAVQDCPPPTDVKQLQRFLGLINFYRRFLPAVARTLQPLTDLLKGSPKVLLWSPAAEAAFVAAKAALVAAVPLCHPAPHAVLSLAVDASDSHVGGVLQQKVGRGWQPLAFYSKKLSIAEAKYSTFDRELLAAFVTIRHFRFLLEGRQFQLLTDHKPLVAAMTRVTPPQSARQQRHLAYISEFTTDLSHTPGSANVVADALSRPPPVVVSAPPAGLPVLSIPPASSSTVPLPSAALLPTVAEAQPIDFLELAFAQLSCPDVQSMVASPSLSVVSRKFGTADVMGDVSTGNFRPLLPAQFRTAATLSLHNIHHPGVRASRRLICSSFCWPKMGAFVSALIRNCIHCQKGKVHRHVSLQAAHIPVPVRRFAHIHVDLVGPLPRSSGFSYLFTVIDRTTRWPEAIPLTSTTAADCAAALLQGWIQRFGVPSIITSDRGPQFTSSLWASLCSLLSISHTQTTSYHPQSNGLVERFHRRLKDALRARTAGADWFSHLPLVMLGVRSAWREDSEFSPAEAVFGSQLVLPGQFLSSPESPSPSFLAEFQGVLSSRSPLQTAHHSTPAPTTLPEDLLLSRFVLVRHDGVQPPLSPLYDGPYLVLERSLHFFKLQIGQRQELISTHRLKPCHAPQDVQAALPPRRGRPPNAAAEVNPPVVGQPSCHSSIAAPPSAKRQRRVSFACPAVSSVSPPPSTPLPPATPPDIKLGRPVRSTKRPAHYTR